jgi:hypothetical protein
MVHSRTGYRITSRHWCDDYGVISSVIGVLDVFVCTLCQLRHRPSSLSDLLYGSVYNSGAYHSSHIWNSDYRIVTWSKPWPLQRLPT